jgi:hypothetical protein
MLSSASRQAGRLQPAGQAAHARRLPGDGLGQVRLAEDHRHVRRPGAHVGRGDVAAVLQLVAQHVDVLLQDRRLLEAAQGRSVDGDARLAAAERDARQGRLQAHQLGQPAHLVERYQRAEADAAFRRPAHRRVVNDVAVALDERAAADLQVEIEVDLLLRLAQQAPSGLGDSHERTQGIEIDYAAHRRSPGSAKECPFGRWKQQGDPRTPGSPVRSAAAARAAPARFIPRPDRFRQPSVGPVAGLASATAGPVRCRTARPQPARGGGDDRDVTQGDAEDATQ